MHLRHAASRAVLPVTVDAAAAALGVSRRGVRRLQEAGYLELTGRAVEALANRPWIEPDAREVIPLLRPGPPAVDPDGRVTGHVRSHDDDTLVEATRAWWQGPVWAPIEAGYLLIAVTGCVVAVLTIHDEEPERVRTTTPRGQNVIRSRFEASLAGRVVDLAADVHEVHTKPDLCGMVLGRRIHNPPGGPLVVIRHAQDA